MEDQIRSRIYEALAVEQPPAGLRARVIDSVPMGKAARQHRGRPSLQWAAGFAAIVVTAAVILGIISYRGSAIQVPGGKPGSASSARLIAPEGIAIGADGNIYVSDYVGNLVYRLQADGSLLTIAGGGIGGDGPATKAYLAHPGGLAIAPDGTLYVADLVGGSVRRIDGQGMISTVAGRSASLFNGPLGLAFDSTGTLYVGDASGDVFRVDANKNLTPLDLSALPPPKPFPGYLAFDAAGNLYIADRAPVAAGIVAPPGGGCRILRFAADGKVSVIGGTGVCGFGGDGGPATAAQLDDPNGIAFDSSGNLYFADSNNHRIRRIDRTGTITTVAGTGTAGYSGDGGPATKAMLEFPFGIVMAPGNLLYISDACGCMESSATGRVRLLRLSDGTIRTVVSSQSRVVTPP